MCIHSRMCADYASAQALAACGFIVINSRTKLARSAGRACGLARLTRTTVGARDVGVILQCFSRKVLLDVQLLRQPRTACVR